MLFFDIEHYKCKWVNALKIVKMGHYTILNLIPSKMYPQIPDEISYQKIVLG